MYLQDADGNGYYAYAPELPADATASEEALDAYFPFGTEVCVTGTGTVYGGQYEFNKGCQVVKTGNVAEEGVLTFENVTEAWGKAKNQGDHDALMGDQNKLVVLEEAIFTKVDGKYYYFTVNGVEFNIYRTNYFMADDADIEALFAKFEVGKAATIKGIVSCYSNLYQIYPLDGDCISNIHTPELNDAQKVAFEKGNLELPATITEAGAIDLPAVGATYNNVAIAWAFKADTAHDCASISEGKLHVELPAEATTITLVATLTCGNATGTLEITIKVESSKIDWNVTADALATCETLENGATTEDFFYFYGTVGEIYNTQYCNFYLLDEEGNSIIVYGLYAPNGTDRYGSKREIAEIPFKEGDLICMRAKVQKYYKSSDGSITPELVSAVHIETPEKGTETFVAYNATEAVEIANSLENGATTEEYAYFSGIVGEIYNTQYCNFYLTDANGGSIIVYGLYAPNGTDRYGSKREIAEIPFKEGDIIVLRSKVQKYYKSSDESITPELVSAVLVSFYTPAGGSDTPAHTCESACPICTGCLDSECTEEACATKCSCVETDAPVAGTYIVEMYQASEKVNYYLTGEMNGYYLATSTSSNDAMSVTLAKLENGNYTLQLADGQYLAMVVSGTHINAVMQETACEFTWNAKLGNFTVTLDGTEYFFGTYGSHNTIGTCKLSYASTNYQAKLVAPLAHTCDSACENCGGCLDSECTEEACTTKCSCPVAGQNGEYTLTIPAKGEKWTATTLVQDIFYATSGVKTESIKLEGAAYEADGLVFESSQISLTGGGVKVSDGIVCNAIGFAVGKGQQATVVVYGALKADKSGVTFVVKNPAMETIEVSNIKINGVDAEALDALAIDAVKKYEFTLGEGIYYFGGSGGGAYVYGMSITLADAPAGEAVTTKTMAEIATANSWADATLYASFDLDENITVTSAGTPVDSYALNTGKYYVSSTTWRIYQNEAPTVTISAAEGYTIVSVKVTYSVKNGGTLTLGTENIASKTLVEVNGTSVTFSVGNTGDKTNGQAQITAIEVVYAPAK